MQRQRHIHAKIEQPFNKNKFTIEETNYKQTHSSGYFSVAVENRNIRFTVSLNHTYT